MCQNVKSPELRRVHVQVSVNVQIPLSWPRGNPIKGSNFLSRPPWLHHLPWQRRILYLLHPPLCIVCPSRSTKPISARICSPSYVKISRQTPINPFKTWWRYVSYSSVHIWPPKKVIYWIRCWSYLNLISPRDGADLILLPWQYEIFPFISAIRHKVTRRQCLPLTLGFRLPHLEDMILKMPGAGLPFQWAHYLPFLTDTQTSSSLSFSVWRRNSTFSFVSCFTEPEFWYLLAN